MRQETADCGEKPNVSTSRSSLSSAGGPEGSRPHLGAVLLGYYTEDGRLIYAGRVGTGMPDKVLADLRRSLDPLARKTSSLNVPPSRKTRFSRRSFCLAC